MPTIYTTFSRTAKLSEALGIAKPLADDPDVVHRVSIDGERWHEAARRPVPEDYDDLYRRFGDPERRFDPMGWSRDFIERVADQPIEEITAQEGSAPIAETVAPLQRELGGQGADLLLPTPPAGAGLWWVRIYSAGFR